LVLRALSASSSAGGHVALLLLVPRERARAGRRGRGVATYGFVSDKDVRKGASVAAAAEAATLFMLDAFGSDRGRWRSMGGRS
jgi:hypothetical protein